MTRSTPQEQYRRRRDSIEDSEAMTDDEKQFIFAYMDAYDPDVFSLTPPKDETPHSYGTLKQKGSIFKRFAENTDIDCTEADASDVNAHLSAMKRGDIPSGPDDGYSPNTVKQAAMGLRVIYDYHGTIEKEDIALPEGESTHVDEADMFTNEDVQALRDACPTVRDRAMLELFIYTGQRLRAIQTLRIKDIFLDDGTFRLNPTVDGLKGASGKRPLLGAVGPVRRWMQQHPTDDRDDALITCLPRTSTGEPGEPLHPDTIAERLDTLGKRADVDKPTNPHNFRHYFVTVCKRDYGLTDSQIKHLLGHRPDSNVMNTTYSHLTDDEIATNVAVEAGFKDEPETASAFSPRTCTTCDEPLPDEAKACPMCGTTFTPDAKAANEQIADMLYEHRAETSSEEMGDILDRIRSKLDEDGELRADILELLVENEEDTR